MRRLTKHFSRFWQTWQTDAAGAPPAKHAAAAIIALAITLATPTLAQQNQISVSGDEADYSADGQSAIFRGNVEVVSDGMRLSAATLRVSSENGRRAYAARAAAGAPLLLLCTNCAPYPIRAEVGESITFEQHTGLIDFNGGVTLCVDENCTRGSLTAAQAQLNRAENQLQLHGAPLVAGRWQPHNTDDPTPAEEEKEKQEVHFQAAQVSYSFADSALLLSGNAKITRGSEKITGERVQFNFARGTIQAGSRQPDTDAAAPRQRVQATFGLSEDNNDNDAPPTNPNNDNQTNPTTPTPD